MLTDVQNILNTNVNVVDVLFNIGVAFACGLIISFVYRIVYNGPNYSASFVNSMVLLAMITSIVIAVIGNSIARAFGLVGAMSIIRFRTAVRDTLDIVFIFLSLTIGMAAGVGLKYIAIFGTLITGLAIILLIKTSYASPNRREVLLQFSAQAEEGSSPAYLAVIDKYCKKNKLVNIKSNGGGFIVDCFYHVVLKDKGSSTEFVSALKKIDGVSNINLFFDKD